MAKAADSLRRGSVKLKALGSGHRDLQLVISEQKAARHEFKNFIRAQKSAAEYLNRWSQNEESEALQGTVSALSELSATWIEVERELAGQLKHTTMAFETTLEEEKAVDQARKHLEQCQRKVGKVQKDLDRLAKKGEDTSAAEQKLEQTSRAKELAECELAGRRREAEANKQNMVRQGLLGMAEAHLMMARKCCSLFETYAEVCEAIPVRHPREQDPPPFTGGAKVDSLVASTIRLLPTVSASSSRSSLYLEPTPAPPSYSTVADGQAGKEASNRNRHQSEQEGGWASDEFDD